MAYRWTCPACSRRFSSRSAIVLPVFCACGATDADGAGIAEIDDSAIPQRPTPEPPPKPDGPVDVLLMGVCQSSSPLPGFYVPAPPCLCEPEIAATIRAYRPQLVILGPDIAKHLDELRAREWAWGVEIRDCEKR